jgi:hypothetical protein
MGYIWEARREAGVEFWREFWRDSEPKGLLVTLGRGEAGTELRSGAMVYEDWCLLALGRFAEVSRRVVCLLCGSGGPRSRFLVIRVLRYA